MHDIIIKYFGDDVRKEQVHLEDARHVLVRAIKPPLTPEMAVRSDLTNVMGNVLSMCIT